MSSPDYKQGERLQKVLANSGLGSRRAIESMIIEGKIKVNGKVAKIGDRIVDSDQVMVGGSPFKLSPNQATRVIMYNKPRGQVCSHKGQFNRPNVFSYLPKLTQGRWVNVGRLDIDTTGLILFTNQGNLANKLMHPSTITDREYSVRVFGRVEESMLMQLKEGVPLSDGISRFTDIVTNSNYHNQTSKMEKVTNQWFTVCLQSGKNREVKRLWESQNIKVNRLKRVRFGPIMLPSYLAEEQWLDLSPHQIEELFDHCQLPREAVYQKNDKKASTRRLQKNNRRLGNRPIKT